MMRRLCTLIASSKACKQPLHIFKRSHPISLVTSKRPYERQLFSSNARVILQELSTLCRNEIEHKSTGGIRVMSIQNVKPD
nr:transferase, chloramphenicol acetyltransferase-like domain protein [Tanacetum cinerariifolium]